MIGAIAGDIIGSVYENLRTKNKGFRLFTPLSTFTDDTVLTVAVADAILRGAGYGETIKRYALRHPMRGYGPRFLLWMATPGIKPYNSFGNGSAMRVSPVAHAFDSEDADRLDERRSSPLRQGRAHAPVPPAGPRQGAGPIPQEGGRGEMTELGRNGSRVARTSRPKLTPSWRCPMLCVVDWGRLAQSARALA